MARPRSAITLASTGDDSFGIGIRAHRLLGGSKLAVAAIAIAGLMILQMAIWTFVSLVS